MSLYQLKHLPFRTHQGHNSRFQQKRFQAEFVQRSFDPGSGKGMCSVQPIASLRRETGHRDHPAGDQVHFAIC